MSTDTVTPVDEGDPWRPSDEVPETYKEQLVAELRRGSRTAGYTGGCCQSRKWPGITGCPGGHCGMPSACSSRKTRRCSSRGHGAGHSSYGQKTEGEPRHEDQTASSSSRHRPSGGRLRYSQQHQHTASSAPHRRRTRDGNAGLRGCGAGVRGPERAAEPAYRNRQQGAGLRHCRAGTTAIASTGDRSGSGALPDTMKLTVRCNSARRGHREHDRRPEDYRRGAGAVLVLEVRSSLRPDQRPVPLRDQVRA